MIKVGILGYGGIARSHKGGYENLARRGAPVELVALCDIDPEQFSKQVEINVGGEEAGSKQYRTYTDLDEMLKNEELDVIDICLPTYLHCEYAVKLLKMGYNVQSEKPMGLNEQQCEEMLAAAKESSKKLMIGMCLRFSSAYLAVKKLIDEGTYGKVLTGHFERISAMPRWGFQNWFRDYERSGGVALDMHIHDVDMIRFMFGEPKAVCAVTNNSKMKCTTIHSTFIYDDKIFTAIGDWGAGGTFRFRSGCRLNFEKATVVLQGADVKVYPSQGEPYDLECECVDYMAEESLYLARTILGEIENEKNKPEDAAGSVRLISKLMESAENGGRRVDL